MKLFSDTTPHRKVAERQGILSFFLSEWSVSILEDCHFVLIIDDESYFVEAVALLSSHFCQACINLQ
jgi:hypothetical protein